MLRNKRGSVTEFILTPTFTTALVLGLVLLSFLWFVNGISAKTSFERQFHSRDLAITIDAALSIPGNVKITYPINGNFTFEINEKKVITKDEGENHYSYSKKKGTEFIPTIIEPKNNQLNILKTGDELLITTENVSDQKLNCYGNYKHVSSVIIDAGHFNNPKNEFNNPGFEHDGIIEADITLKLGQALKNSANIPIEETRHLERATEGKQAGLDAPINILERIDKITNSNADILISLHTGNYEEKFYVKAFVHPDNYEEDYKLACHILNKIEENLERNIDGLAIIPLNPDYSGDENNQVLGKKEGVLLEIGSIKNSLTTQEIITIAQSILEGLK